MEEYGHNKPATITHPLTMSLGSFGTLFGRVCSDVCKCWSGCEAETKPHAKTTLCHQSNNDIFRLVNTRFALETLTNILFKGCEYAKPQFDHSLHFRMAFLFKLVNTHPLRTCYND